MFKIVRKHLVTGESRKVKGPDQRTLKFDSYEKAINFAVRLTFCEDDRKAYYEVV